ncbi:MAG TPA: tetratricopeptide repeat protein [Pyrinomonadaceae bacterium]|nr:tetratricopeptide repeat protein [Pyrinomonadaceae bacterium]
MQWKAPRRPSINLSVLALAALCCFVLPVEAVAQGSGGVDRLGTGGKHAITGRIYLPSGQRADVRAKVKLVSVQHAELTVLADLNGAFSFRSLAPGSYTVVVEGDDHYETATEPVFIDGALSNPRSGVVLPSIARAYQVQIYLQPKRLAPANKPGVISAELASVPESARKLYEKAMAMAQSGESQQAIEQLKQAVALYPGFVMALNELGVQYLKIAQPARAVEVLSSAVKLRADAFTPRLNYGVALLESKDFRAAEEQLREAIKRNDFSPTAHLYLGITLISLRDYDQAEKELVRAIRLGGTNIGLAHYYLGGLYWRKKEYKLAADELELFLRQSPNSPEAARVRQTIKELRSKS